MCTVLANMQFLSIPHPKPREAGAHKCLVLVVLRGNQRIEVVLDASREKPAGPGERCQAEWEFSRKSEGEAAMKTCLQ